MNLVLPDVLPENAKNAYVQNFYVKYGCQIVPMKFYQQDHGLKLYEEFFNDNNAGIIPLSTAIMYYQKLDQQNT
jgi:hypothetical protein